MIDLDTSVYIQFINFVITLVVLNLLLIRPVREIIRKRAEKMSGLLQGAEAFTASAEQKLAGYQKALDEARAAGAEARNALREQGVSKEKEILEAAGADAAATLSSAKERAASEAKTARDGLKARVGSLAQKVADKILA
ncbi:MAG: ATP synthase F0 subunit B [Thermodesulfobacteriota bacterium]